MNEQTFLAALNDDPNDEVTWLALADWLEEDGQTPRAELVRLTRQLHAMPPVRQRRTAAFRHGRPLVTPAVLPGPGVVSALPVGRKRLSLWEGRAGRAVAPGRTWPGEEGPGSTGQGGR